MTLVAQRLTSSMKRMIGRPPLAVAQLDTSRKLLASQRSLQSLTPKAVTKTHFQLVVVFSSLWWVFFQRVVVTKGLE